MARVSTPASVLIGSRIAARRVAQKMTVDQLAVGASIDSSNIRSYESGRALTSLSSLVRIAEALGVDAGELIEGVSSEMFVRDRA